MSERDKDMAKKVKMVYWVENDEIGRKEVENVQKETKWSLGDEKRGARNVKRGQN